MGKINLIKEGIWVVEFSEDELPSEEFLSQEVVYVDILTIVMNRLVEITDAELYLPIINRRKIQETGIVKFHVVVRDYAKDLIDTTKRYFKQYPEERIVNDILDRDYILGLRDEMVANAAAQMHAVAEQTLKSVYGIPVFPYQGKSIAVVSFEKPEYLLDCIGDGNVTVGVYKGEYFAVLEFEEVASLRFALKCLEFNGKFIPAPQAYVYLEHANIKEK